MSKKKKNQIGKIFTITGLLLFAAALALSAYNLWDGYRAEQSREKLLEEYRDKNQDISDEGEQAEEFEDGHFEGEKVEKLTIFNFAKSRIETLDHLMR